MKTFWLKKHLPRLLNILVLALLMYLIWNRFLPMYLSNSDMEGRSSPHFSAVTLTGHHYETSEDNGTKRILVFWATWCAPCKVELSRLQNLIDEKKIKADQIIAISSGEDERLLRKTALRRGYTFPIIADHYGTIAAAYNVSATPTIIFRDKAGQITWATSGISPLLSLRTENFLND